MSKDDGHWPTWTAYVALALVGAGIVAGLAVAVTSIDSAGDLLSFVGPAAGPVAALVVTAAVVAFVRLRLARRHQALSRRSQARLAEVLDALHAERAVPAEQRTSRADDASLERVAADLRAGLRLVDEGVAPLAADRIDAARRAAEAGWAPHAPLTRDVTSLWALVDEARRVERGVTREVRREADGGPGSGAAHGAGPAGGGRSRWRSILRRPGVKPLLVVAFIGLVFAVRFLPSADHGEVVERLEEVYGVPVEWDPNGSYERDTLIVDGEDLSEDCRVTGDWGPLDDLAIECDGATGPVPVQE